MSDRVSILMDAVKSNDVAVVRQLLSADSAELKPALDSAMPGWIFGETPLIAAVRADNRKMVDALLEAGANIDGRTKWWAGGFGVLDEASEPMAAHLIARGVYVDAHAAAKLGKLDHLRMLVEAAPALVHARAGDGMMPLHFAATVEVAQYLVSCGADIDAVDVDHESTAAQYMVRDRQDVARYLVSKDCRTDILMGAALGDWAVVERHLDSLRMCVSPKWFPMKNPRAGGSIYIWTLGEMKTAHQIAREFGHTEIYERLMKRSPTGLRLAVACEVGDTPPEGAVDAEDHGRIVNAAKANDTARASRMLNRGWPVDSVYGGATALHWAAFHGNLSLVELLIARGAPLDFADAQFQGTPAGWAAHGSSNSWLRETGDYPSVIARLGGTPEPTSQPA